LILHDVSTTYLINNSEIPSKEQGKRLRLILSEVTLFLEREKMADKGRNQVKI
jgi:hypothetical protein